MINTVMLLLSMTLPNGSTYWAPGTYYENKTQCELKVAHMAGSLNKTGNPWKFQCAEVVPEVVDLTERKCDE